MAAGASPFSTEFQAWEGQEICPPQLKATRFPSATGRKLVNMTNFRSSYETCLPASGSGLNKVAVWLLRNKGELMFVASGSRCLSVCLTRETGWTLHRMLLPFCLLFHSCSSWPGSFCSRSIFSVFRNFLTCMLPTLSCTCSRPSWKLQVENKMEQTGASAERGLERETGPGPAMVRGQELWRGARGVQAPERNLSPLECSPDSSDWENTVAPPPLAPRSLFSFFLNAPLLPLSSCSEVPQPSAHWPPPPLLCRDFSLRGHTFSKMPQPEPFPRLGLRVLPSPWIPHSVGIPVLETLCCRPL